ncbi:MAG TPA: DUF2283 domain-containing protein [Candidatus Tyrphobacter sp.]
MVQQDGRRRLWGYIDESEEVKPGIVFDFDTLGRLVAIGIEHASKTVDLEHLPVSA